MSVNSEINKGSEFIFAIPIKLGKEKECNNCEIDRKYKTKFEPTGALRIY